MANYYVVTGSSVWGRAFQANADVVGGLVTGSKNQFVSLPVSPSSGVPSDSSLYLSSSFAGYSGSIISAINRALALANEQGEVTWSEVSGALASADSVAYLPRNLELNGGAELKVGGAMSGSSTLAVGGILTAGADVLPAIDSLYDLGSEAKQWAQLHVDNLQADQLGAALDANSQAITNINVDSGNIDGVTIATSDITVGAGKTLNVSAGTLTLADDQISGDKISGGTIGTITISQLAGAMDVNDQAMTNVNIDSGAIDGTNITVGAAKTLDVSAGTLTTSQEQKLAIVEGVGADTDIGAFQFTAQTLVADVADGTAPMTITSTTKVDNLNVDKLDGQDWASPAAIGTSAAAAGTFTTLNATTSNLGTLGSAVNCASQAFTNVNVDSGAIDGAIIGANEAAAGSFTTVQASSNVTAQGSITGQGGLTGSSAQLASGDFVVGVDGALTQAGSSTFTGGANFGVITGASAGSSTLFVAGDDASGTPKLYRLAVSGGILRAEQQ